MHRAIAVLGSIPGGLSESKQKAPYSECYCDMSITYSND